MKIIRAKIFDKFPEVVFGMSTKFKLDEVDKFNFNMSLNIGDEIERVEANRKLFCESIGLNIEDIIFQHQIHSDIIKISGYGGCIGDSDAIITPRKGLGVAVSTADCTTIYLYDAEEKIIAGVHSGWRGTEKGILKKTLEILFTEFDSNPKNIFAYIAPAISQKNYEVGSEVAEKFNEKYLIKSGEKYLLDVSQINYDILISSGILKQNIEKSDLCSYEEEYLHSYRRDGAESGRAIGILAFR